MLTRKRFVPPTIKGDWNTDGPVLVKAICDYLMSLEGKQSLSIANATGIDGTPIGANERAAGAFTAVGVGIAATTGLDVVGAAGNAVPAATVRVDNNAGINFVVQRAADGGGTLAFGASTNHNVHILANNTVQLSLDTSGNSRFGGYVRAGLNNGGMFTKENTSVAADGNLEISGTPTGLVVVYDVTGAEFSTWHTSAILVKQDAANFVNVDPGSGGNKIYISNTGTTFRATNRFGTARSLKMMVFAFTGTPA